ncbi:hypothetical protein FKW77_008417 [Venturia effusa]|uniref:Uncharacterized protein n=1 Tax=Venturia effusa TaxID=50376 RepID=A0A517KZV1_9PEZI|nr:hypothetical protein FKW77_008417 [Venturia effusa]
MGSPSASQSAITLGLSRAVEIEQRLAHIILYEAICKESVAERALIRKWTSSGSANMLHLRPTVANEQTIPRVGLRNGLALLHLSFTLLNLTTRPDALRNLGKDGDKRIKQLDDFK